MINFCENSAKKTKFWKCHTHISRNFFPKYERKFFFRQTFCSLPAGNPNSTNRASEHTGLPTKDKTLETIVRNLFSFFLITLQLLTCFFLLPCSCLLVFLITLQQLTCFCFAGSLNIHLKNLIKSKINCQTHNIQKVSGHR